MTTTNACAGLEPPTTNKPPEDDSRLLKIKKLKAKLINEEHRLVLMKKIRQSQTRPIAAQSNAPGGSVQSNNNNTSSSSSSLNINTNNSIINHNINNTSNVQSTLGGQIKKLRPNQSSGPLGLHKNLSSLSAGQGSSSSLSSASTPSLNQTPAHAHQRPKVNTLWNPPQQARHPTPAGIAAPHVGNLSRQPITTPPNVVQAMMGNLTGSQSLLMNQINAAAASSVRRNQQQQQSHQQPPFNAKTQAAQMLMQKRPNQKPSIQKQLEQTLLQQQHQHLLQQQQSQKHAQGGLGFSSNLNKRSVGITSPHVGNLSRPPITTPPNVVQDLRGALSGQQSLLMNSNNLSSAAAAAVAAAASRRTQQTTPSQQSTSPLQSSSFNKAQSAQMLLQKKTAAKSAIQKQLEQTLMQLPQKHVQVGIDFVPNANNIEFVYYVGLEACVDYLTDTKNPLDIQPLEKPFECSTCGTDFTPAWSWKRSNAVCENCVSNHMKKSIKNSQANRIKSILSRAAKQEQEMEQRIMAEAATVVATASPTSSTSQQQHSLLQPVSHHHNQPQQHHHHQPQSQRGSSSQAWPRINASPHNVVNTNRSTHVQQPQQPPPQPPPQINTNPLAGLQPAALASLLQMNPQLSTLASLMTANNNNTNNTNQFAQVAALLMNQLTMNLAGNFKR